jgi:DNA anti-recombination protein RmuC
MIEQILAFVLGAGSVFLIWGVVVAFRTANKVKELERDITDLHSWIQRNDELVNRRIDQEIDRVDNLNTASNKYIDSRVDKLESKFEAKFNDIFSYDESKRFEIDELRQRINNIKELVDDITGLTFKK